MSVLFIKYYIPGDPSSKLSFAIVLSEVGNSTSYKESNKQCKCNFEEMFFISFKSIPLPKRFVFTVMDKWVLFFRISLALVSWTFSKFCPLTSKICKKKMTENYSLFCIDFHSFQATCMLKDQQPFYTSF